ncbi:hypothetical protein V8C86DRAFT_2452491, partial [Haematococcus lacustris]
MLVAVATMLRLVASSTCTKVSHFVYLPTLAPALPTPALPGPPLPAPMPVPPARPPEVVPARPLVRLGPGVAPMDGDLPATPPLTLPGLEMPVAVGRDLAGAPGIAVVPVPAAPVVVPPVVVLVPAAPVPDGAVLGAGVLGGRGSCDTRKSGRAAARALTRPSWLSLRPA